ncbi:amidohydrolase family protein [Pseudoroseomonas cervicalis]|uniref:Amidohydrolase family protein n=1 Tax=Pseudoroseomonas cervicalis ATCC 49957 TaxID=525371 RepID=D5RJJ9_9PROT|nr:amidohydrolase family protein [Pseudoroseomonas cervicalis]EFH12517.1 amidohydrolase family protein [Pseudoroseomonas cervicalis ATCC 49957]
MNRIDAHHHIWDLSRPGYGWIGADSPLRRDVALADLRPLLGPVTATLLVQADDSDGETEYLLRQARESGGLVRGVVGWADLAAPDAPARITALARNPLLKGLRPMLQDIPERDWILRADVARGLHAMQEAGLRLDLLVLPHHLPLLPELVARHPDLPMVIDHAAKPPIRAGTFEPWASDMARAAACPGLHCKLSGLLTEAPPGADADTLRPWVAHLLRHFGSGRLIWGSDWPVLELAAPYARWLDLTDHLLAPLEEAARAAILGGNARRFYGLG